MPALEVIGRLPANEAIALFKACLRQRRRSRIEAARIEAQARRIPSDGLNAFVNGLTKTDASTGSANGRATSGTPNEGANFFKGLGKVLAQYGRGARG
jgi:hypothetical protein